MALNRIIKFILVFQRWHISSRALVGMDGGFLMLTKNRVYNVSSLHSILGDTTKTGLLIFVF